MVSTRNNGFYEIGSYEKLINPPRAIRTTRIQTPTRVSSTRTRSMVNKINQNLHSLLQIRKSNDIVKFNVEITFPIFSYLQNTPRFALSGRYEQKEGFIDEFNLLQQRRINENDSVEIDRTFFEMRLFKKKDIHCNGIYIKGSTHLSIKFRKREVVTPSI